VLEGEGLIEQMLNVLLDTRQVISGNLFPDNLLAITEKSEKPGDAQYKT